MIATLGSGPRAAGRREAVTRTRARLNVATLNMRGSGLVRSDGSSDKWLLINQLMRDQRIAVLAVQEAHLPQSRIDNLNSLFSASLLIVGSEDPTNPTAARGVATVFNRRLINVDNVRVTVTVPGRAILTEFMWSKGTTLKVENIYAPNDMAESAAFWGTLRLQWEASASRRPDLLLGDFNVVTEPLDRLPARNDHADTVASLNELLACANMSDAWRMMHDRRRDFTFLQVATNSQSRIDRAYVTRTKHRCVVDVRHEDAGIPTDHRLVILELANYDAPYVGTGRWRMHTMLLADKEFLKQVQQRGMKLQNDLQQMGERTRDTNVQTLYAKMAKDRARERVPKMQKRIEGLRVARDNLLNRPLEATEGITPRTDDEDVRAEAALLQDRIAKLEIKRFGHKRHAVAARDWLEGETICKYWTKVNAAPKEDETIYEMAVPVSEPQKMTPAFRTQRHGQIASVGHCNR
ncbi:DNase I-like protein [Lentinus brumalis]|uniref:DNase I-like protein n=1 Tax=Lentinus brumalis TaxID=2498619 RepID=A0A371CUD4_9APHY|nr:DNase I-like protein [Polyporus brumalis]